MRILTKSCLQQLTLLLLFACCSSVQADLNGSLLVANGGIVYEYSSDGTYLGQLTGDLRNGVFSESRGIAYDRFGRVHVLIRPHEGDDTMFLATWDPADNSTVYNEISFHNHNGNVTYGDIGADGDYVYAPDQVFALESQGVIRYPLKELSAPDRVLEQFDPTDVSVGLDGKLYVQSSNGGDINIVDPETLSVVGSFSTVNDMRDVAATRDGTIFTIHNDRMVRRYSPDGTLEASLQLPSGANHSMALSIDGTIVIGSSGEAIFFTDTTLTSFVQLPTPASLELSWGNFVCFANPYDSGVPGDVNGDGTLDLLDVAPFVDAVNDGEYLPAADVNNDGVVDLLDVQPFIDLLTGG